MPWSGVFPLKSMEDQQYPSASKQMANLTKTAFGIIKEFVSTGDLLVPDHVKDARLQICSTCQFYDEVEHRCTDCGCYLSNKVRFSASKCPLDFW